MFARRAWVRLGLTPSTTASLLRRGRRSVPWTGEATGRTSALGLRHLGLGVGDGALERLDVVAFGLTDDAGDGPRHGGLDLSCCGVRVGHDQPGAPDRDRCPGLLL